jgi:BMFP domain-containing protein YqiC
LTGTESANRPEFQQLLRDAERGRFEAILLHEQSQFLREDIFDVMLHWRLLWQAGVAIVTCQRGRLQFDNLGGILTAIIDQHGAREESIKLATRVVSGQRLRLSQGKRIGGIVFGYDREYLDEQGRVVRVHFRDHFRKPPSWSSRLVPSEDADAVAGVQWAFEAIRQGQSVYHVVRGFNQRGLTTTYGKPFTYSAVRGMLANPAYAGVLRRGRYSRAKFCRLKDEGEIMVENAHEALVTPDDFEEVQAILRRRKRHHERSAPGRYLLGGLVTCMHCGKTMYAVQRKERETQTPQAFHQCNNAPLAPGFDPNLPHPAVRVDRLEAFVLDVLRQQVLETRAAERIKTAIVRAKARCASQVSADERRLRTVREKIERGTENLALAAREDFAGISNLLTKWRAEEADLLDRIESRGRDLEPLPESLEVIAAYGDLSTRLKQADRVKLAHAMKQTVVSITIGTRTATTGKLTHPELFGELRLHEALHVKPIAIPDTAIGRRKTWRELGALVAKADHPLHLADFAKYIGTPDLSRAAHNVRRAEMAGLIKKIGSYGGWVAAD